MAWISRDNYHGGWRVTGLDQDIEKAQKNRQFHQGMNDLGNRMVDAPENILKGTVRDTAAIAGVGVAVGVGMVRNRRFRYIMQAILHFPMSFIVIMWVSFTIGVIAVPSGLPASETGSAIDAAGARSALIALIGMIVWSLAYIYFRTVPKMPRLRQYQ